uniref:Uncharacterized protein n=1 Tax=Meloidogyne javanica TaxID=6303 RepID=A0A915MSC6_MELJA
MSVLREKSIDNKFYSDLSKLLKSEKEIETDPENLAHANRLILEHLIGLGRTDVAETFIKESDSSLSMPDISNSETLREIMSAFKQFNYLPAIEWLKDCAPEKKDLLFRLQCQHIIRLLETSDKMAALKYVRELQSFPFEDYKEELSHLMFVVISYPQKGPYEYLFHSGRWFGLEEELAQALTDYRSSLTAILSAGAKTVPSLLTMRAFLSSARPGSTSTLSDELPCNVPIPEQVHSSFCCPILKVQSTETNPPVRLCCGHVISMDAMNKLAQQSRNNRLKCPYCPLESVLQETKEEMASNPPKNTILRHAHLLRLLAQSQIGYNFRHLDEPVRQRIVQLIVGGGNVYKIEEEKGQNLRSTNKKSVISDTAERAQVVAVGIQTQGGFTLNNDGTRNYPSKPLSKPPPFIDTKSSSAESEFSTNSVQVFSTEANVIPSLPKDYHPTNIDSTNKMSKSSERKVPTTRVSRLFNFGKLAIGLGTGTAKELLRRRIDGGGNSLKITSNNSNTSSISNPFFTPENAERIVQMLCRVRGAALKLGQMISIQDDKTIPPFLLEIFERVRQSADFIPAWQVEQQMKRELGPNWIKLFRDFNIQPFAAASIGQVHEAITLDGTKVAVKVQYPGIANGIEADFDNLLSLLSFGRVLPKGLFLENFAAILKWSRAIGFLTGSETKIMEDAHCDSISIIAETLTFKGSYNFALQNITSRVNRLVPLMLQHRLTAPPEEIYSLHRKLSGSFLLATKLQASVPCGLLFNYVADNYQYSDGN